MPGFDVVAFRVALDHTRQARGMLWKDVAAQAGVSASSLTRIAQGGRPDVDGFAALVAWAHLSADDFLHHDDEPLSTDTLARVVTHLHADRRLRPEAVEALQSLITVAYRQLTSAAC